MGARQLHQHRLSSLQSIGAAFLNRLTESVNNSPHLLPPEAILSAHLSPFLAEQTSIASTRLDMIQKANVTLADEISAQRQELDGLVQGFESSVRDLEGASDAFNQDQMQGVDDDLVEFANASS